MSKPTTHHELERLIDAARAHGEQSDPDHEVGDLTDMLRDCWVAMTPKQRAIVYKIHEDKIADWGESSVGPTFRCTDEDHAFLKVGETCSRCKEEVC